MSETPDVERAVPGGHVFPRAAVDGDVPVDLVDHAAEGLHLRNDARQQIYGSSEIYSTNFRSQPFCLRCSQNSFKHA